MTTTQKEIFKNGNSFSDGRGFGRQFNLLLTVMVFYIILHAIY